MPIVSRFWELRAGEVFEPEHPNLYRLTTQLVSGDKVTDETTTTVGFRLFQVRGSKTYLNGKPYFMRGANAPPFGIRPCDTALAQKFMKLMHDGNQMVTRFTCGPAGHTWLDAADRQGVGVSQEGHWPWVMLYQAPPPDPGLLTIWKKEMLDYARAYRNHPSILFWTVSNESYFAGGHDPDKDRRLRKYRIFSDLIKGLRALTPDMPVVMFSGYIRQPADYDELIKPNGLDDGDMDDRHVYMGWYQPSPFHLSILAVLPLIGDPGATASPFRGRPYISQEGAPPYTNVDTGHSLVGYVTKARAWVGKYADFTERPDRFLEIQALLAKENAEKVRREATYLTGWNMFCNYCWFQDSYDAQSIRPFPIYWEVKKALQPVLVSLESANRHFEAGETFSSRVFAINDDPDRGALTDLTLKWRVFGESEEATSGSVRFPDCPYDGKCSKDVQFEIPVSLPLERSNMTLELRLLRGSEVVSRNTYALLCASPKWYTLDSKQEPLLVLETDGKTGEYLRGIGARCESVKLVDWASLGGSERVVVGPDVNKAGLGSAEAFGQFVQRGGRVLLLSPAPEPSGSDLLLADTTLGAIPGFRLDGASVVRIAGDYVDAEIPDLLEGMDPMDMHWFNAMPGDMVGVCRLAYQMPDGPAVMKLATHVKPHEYIKAEEVLKKISWPVFQVKCGQGKVLVSSVLLADDPVAKRFLVNELKFLVR